MPFSVTICRGNWRARWRAVLTILIASLILAGCDADSPSDPTNEPPRSAVSAYPQARVLADFSLLNPEGQAVGRELLQGDWHLLFFGFTHCPDICPTTLHRLGLAQAAWPGPTDPPQVVMISADPQRDTPERMNAYLDAFQGNFTGLTGDHRQIAALATQLGARLSLPDTQGADPDHSAAVYVINPQGNLKAVIAPDFEPADMARDLSRLLENTADA